MIITRFSYKVNDIRNAKPLLTSISKVAFHTSILPPDIKSHQAKHILHSLFESALRQCGIIRILRVFEELGY